jgi:hypothetical protein
MAAHPFTALIGIAGSTSDIVERGAPTAVRDVDTVILAGWHRPVTDLYLRSSTGT